MRIVLAPLGLVALACSTASSQQYVPVAEEPMHHLMLETEALQVLDPRIQPGDTTLFHLHDAPIHYVMISASPAAAQVRGEPWPETGVTDRLTRSIGEGWWTLEYADEPLIHRVTNVGDALFRLIAVTNLGGPRSAGTSGRAAPPAALPGTIEAESAWFRRARLALAPGETAPLAAGPDPVVAIQVSPGRLDIRSGDRPIGSVGALGEWVLLEAGADYELRSAGPGPVTVVLVQVLRE